MTAPALQLIGPTGWADLSQLGPIPDRIDTRCIVCGGPAIVGLPNGWRCANHPPTRPHWGWALNFTPRPDRYCPPRRCHCGRCPQYQLAGSPQQGGHR